jgi:hypothetical protein
MLNIAPKIKILQQHWQHCQILRQNIAKYCQDINIVKILPYHCAADKEDASKMKANIEAILCQI